MLLTLGKTLLLYVVIFLVFFASTRIGPAGGDAALKQAVLTFGAAALVILGALFYAVYKAFSASPQWWFVVAAHVVLGAAIFVWQTL